MAYPKAMQELIEGLGHLPGIGRRTAERLAEAMLDWEEGALQRLGDQIMHLKQRIHHCERCGNLSDGGLCAICRAPDRTPRLLCIVEHARQIPAMEKGGRFHGLYHVLGGRLSPLEGIEAADLNLQTLYDRVADDAVDEVILSTSPDVEGEATAAYIAAELRARSAVAVSRIALGIPVGADLTFADAATVAMALDARRPMAATH